jgi:lactobin A/cerein 7B family class IIb bacteriocin
MSVKDLKSYGRVCVESPLLAAKAKEIGVDNIPGQIEHARSLGFNWDEDDMRALAAEMQPQELSEEELEEISTGFVTTTAAVVGSAVVGAAAAVVGAGAAVTSTTSGSGW